MQARVIRGQSLLKTRCANHPHTHAQLCSARAHLPTGLVASCAYAAVCERSPPPTTASPCDDERRCPRGMDWMHDALDALRRWRVDTGSAADDLWGGSKGRASSAGHQVPAIKCRPSRARHQVPAIKCRPSRARHQGSGIKGQASRVGHQGSGRLRAQSRPRAQSRLRAGSAWARPRTLSGRLLSCASRPAASAKRAGIKRAGIKRADWRDRTGRDQTGRDQSSASSSEKRQGATRSTPADARQHLRNEPSRRRC